MALAKNNSHASTSYEEQCLVQAEMLPFQSRPVSGYELLLQELTVVQFLHTAGQANRVMGQGDKRCHCRKHPQLHQDRREVQDTNRVPQDTNGT